MRPRRGRSGRGRGRAPGPPVSLHRLAVHRRGGVDGARCTEGPGGTGRGQAAGHRPSATRPRARIVARPDRGNLVAGFGRRGGARPRRVLRRHLSSRRTGAARRGRGARGGHPSLPRRHRTHPGPEQHGAALPSGRGPAGLVGAHPPDDVVGAGLRRTGRQLVRPGGAPTSPVANGGAFGGKRASAVPGEARRLAERTGRPARCPLAARGRRAARSQATPAGRRAARRRLGLRAPRAEPRVSGPLRAGVAPAHARAGAGGRGGSGRRAARLVRPARRRLGRGSGRARRPRRSARSRDADRRRSCHRLGARGRPLHRRGRSRGGRTGSGRSGGVGRRRC